jgi:K+-transporting ATPase ATPase A chain
LTNFWQMLAIFALIPSGLTYMPSGADDEEPAPWLGGVGRDGVLFLAGVTTAYWAESRRQPAPRRRPTSDDGAMCNPGGNMEGKEVRFGIANSALFATITTDASCGAVNSMHDSFTPLGGLVPL